MNRATLKSLVVPFRLFFAASALALALVGCIEPTTEQAQCSEDFECDDGLACTVDYCDDGVCKAVSTVSAVTASVVGACSADIDCAPLAGPCQIATCVVTQDVCSIESGTCRFEVDPACNSCDTSADCAEILCGAAECLGGECVAAEGECQTDADCGVDELGCSTASCVQLGDGCGFVGVCVDTPTGACGCQDDVDCDDDNPCSTDLCMSGECINIDEPACLFDCVSDAELLPLLEATSGAGWIKTEGEVGAAAAATGQCQPQGHPVLSDDLLELELSWTLWHEEPGIDAPGFAPFLGQPTCQSSSCSGGESCDGIIAGARYRVWGESLGTPSRPMVDVAGFCLSTHPANLTGRYNLEMTQEETLSHLVELVAEDSGTLRLVGPGPISELEVEAFSGYVELFVPGTDDPAERIRLFANGNDLIGSVYNHDGVAFGAPDGTDIGPVLGTTTVRLTRLP